jgi:ribonucleotide reductase beta subunit family protein with ferritin-like domain
MLKDFSNILSSIGNSPEKTVFTDKYREIMNLYKQNNVLRRELEDKLEKVTQGYKYKDSKEFLDSTVYVSVLWTILATTILFYVFRKM